jgi:hypothetical protein
MLTTVLAMIVLLGGCVTNAEFKDYKIKAAKDLENSVNSLKTVHDILLCETRVDAYEDLRGSDEPDPTRRDEPTGTRRDLASCQAELDSVTGPNLVTCQPRMVQCVQDGVHTNPECSACYKDCLTTSTWPVAGPGSCP